MTKKRIYRGMALSALFGLSAALALAGSSSSGSGSSGSSGSGSGSGSGSSGGSSSTPHTSTIVQTQPNYGSTGSVGTDSGGTTNQDGILNANDIKGGDGDHPDARRSHVDDYRYQQDEVNLDAKSGLVKVLRTDQKSEVNDFDTKVIPLRYASPREIRNVMRLVTGLEGGYAEVFTDANTKDSFIQVVAPKFMMPYLVDAIHELDVQWLKEYWTGSTDIYLKLQNRGDASFVDQIASTYAGYEGFTTIDTTNNALRRLDEEYRAKEYQRAVEAVDIPANQVQLDVKLYEISDSNDTKLGLDYINWKNGPGRNLFDFAKAGIEAHQSARGLTSVYDPFLGTNIFVPTDNGTRTVLDDSVREGYRAINYLLPSNFIDFMQTKGRARVVDTASVMVQSAQTATIFNSQEILAFVVNSNTSAGSSSSSSSSSASATGTVSPAADTPPIVDGDRQLNYDQAGTVGMRMAVTPYVGLESMELEISLRLAEATGLTAEKLPIINRRSLHTTVRLLDGQPFVLGGVSKSTSDQSSAKAPWAGDLPVVGYLFGGETNLKRQSQFVIVVTPHFYVSSQAKIAKPPRIDTLQLIIDGTQPMGLPQMQLGYDQWIFDKRS